MFDSISSALGTSGGGGGLLGALASVDPGPAIGKTLAGLDKTVNRAIHGGWITVGALAAGGLAIAYAPEIMALSAQTGVAPATLSESLGVPGVVAEGSAAGTPVTASTFGSFSAAPSSGIGLSGAIPSGAVVGTGEAGTTIGGTYLANSAGGLALDAAGNAIPYSSIGVGGVAPVSGIGASDVLNAAKKAKSMSDLLKSSGLTGNQATQYAQQLASAVAPTQTSLTQQVKTQSPYLTTNQEPTQIMNQTTQPIDLLSSLGKANSTQPTLADLLRMA